MALVYEEVWMMTMPGLLMRRSSEPRCDAVSSAASRAKHSHCGSDFAREILTLRRRPRAHIRVPRGLLLPSQRLGERAERELALS